MVSDLGAVHDVVEDLPDVVSDLVEKWDNYVQRNGVILP